MMNILENIKKATNYILFEERESVSSDSTEKRENSEHKTSKTLKECFVESLKMSFVGDAQLSGWRDYVYYFTYCPFCNTKNGFGPVNTEGMTEDEMLRQEAERFNQVKTSKLVFDWINFGLFVVYGWLWFLCYNAFIICTELPIRFLERVLLNKFKQPNQSKIAKGIYGTLFAITKLLRVTICMVTSPLQNIKDALSLKEQYPKIATTLAAISGIVSAAVAIVSLFVSYGLSFEFFRTSLGSYIVPRLVEHPIKLTLLNTGLGISYNSVLMVVIPKGSEIYEKIKASIRNSRIYKSICSRHPAATVPTNDTTETIATERQSEIVTDTIDTAVKQAKDDQKPVATEHTDALDSVPVASVSANDGRDTDSDKPKDAASHALPKSTVIILTVTQSKDQKSGVQHNHTAQTQTTTKQNSASESFFGIPLHTGRTLTPGQWKVLWDTPTIPCVT